MFLLPAIYTSSHGCSYLYRIDFVLSTTVVASNTPFNSLKINAISSAPKYEQTL
jgi:hypothetical protein